MKILLAVDGSEESMHAVNEVASQQLQADTQIKVVSAYQRAPLITRLEPMGASEEYYAKTDNTAMQTAEDAAENAADVLRIKHPGITVTASAIDGSPPTVILDEADVLGADLIVMGSHGYGMVKRFLLGSVSHAVALHANCSVKIVRPREFGNDGLKVLVALVAIDGSKKSETAVNEVARQRFPAGSEVQVISVVEPTYSPSAYPIEGIYTNVYQAVEESEKDRARLAVENAVAKLRLGNESSEVIFSTTVLWGSAKQAILDQADIFDPDLIFVGAHGHGMIERFLIGSVAQAVALHAKCSVEIVRERAAEAALSAP